MNNHESAKTYFSFFSLSDSYNNTALGTTSLYSVSITALESPCTINEKRQKLGADYSL